MKLRTNLTIGLAACDQRYRLEYALDHNQPLRPQVMIVERYREPLVQRKIQDMTVNKKWWRWGR